MNKPLLFATESYSYLKKKLLSQSGFDDGSLEINRFPDGERYMRINTDVDHRHVIIIGGTISDSDTLEMYDLASAAVKYGAESLTLAIPYFGYSTMERAVKYGEVVTAKTRATLLSSIPRTSQGNKVILIDLHTEGLPHYFESGIRPVHLYSKPVILDACRSLYGNDFILASTDAGRAKWVESLANDLQVNAAFIFKRRISGTQTQVAGINADVQGKKVIIYDDMIRTGGSIISAAKAYLQAGALEISVITTHGLFVGESLEKMKQAGCVKKIVCTDTHPNAYLIQDPFLEVRTVANLLRQKLLE
ncbi:MAG: ribose-phosphate diphosphokinase [Cytophagaceae bacterium]|jgi:ribose-phosphate pyrophosphokinase|nr:ribose-phosphate diphosphokinase [Cytophagaceae bacterium]